MDPTATAPGPEPSGLFRTAEREEAFDGLVRALLARAPEPSTVSAEVAVLLRSTVDGLPVRPRRELRARYGADAGAASARVIDDAAEVAGWVSAAATRVAAPPAVVHGARVLACAAAELRMLAELYTLHGEPRWSPAVLAAWTAGQPVAAGSRPAVSPADLADRVGRAAREPLGAAATRRLGQRQQRRMRPHPGSWRARPATGAAVSTDPREHLRTAWGWHRRARADAGAAAGYGLDAEVVRRLRLALRAQEGHLRHLTRRLTGREAHPVVPPAVPHPDPAAAAAQVHDRVSRAEDAIDAAEDAGTRPRRLASWPARPRNALVYLAVAVTVSAPAAYLLASGHAASGPPLWALTAAQCLVLPLATVAIGRTAIGYLFRPWLGGDPPRLVSLGAFVAYATHTAVTLAAGAVA